MKNQIFCSEIYVRKAFPIPSFLYLASKQQHSGITSNILSQQLEANFLDKIHSINVSFPKGYTSHPPCILLYRAAILFGYHGNQVTCKRTAKAILKMGIGGAYRNNFKMAVYLCPSVVWSFPAEVGRTHIPRRCWKSSWSWTGWRWIVWSREESDSREVNFSGGNSAVRKLGRWSEFRVYRRSLIVFLTQCFPSGCGGDYVSFECDSVKCFVNPTPNTTCFMFYFLQNCPNEHFPSPPPS